LTARLKPGPSRNPAQDDPKAASLRQGRKPIA